MKYFILLLSVAFVFFFIKPLSTEPKENSLIGEWIVASGGDAGNLDFIGNILKFSKDSVRVFDNGYKTTPYKFDGKRLAWAFPGYDSSKYTVEEKYGNLLFKHEAETSAYVLENYYTFNWMVFFVLVLVGLIAIYGLHSVYTNLHVLIASVFWPKIKVHIQEAFVDKRKHTRYKNQATLQDRMNYEVEDNHFFKDKLTFYSYRPVARFNFKLDDQTIAATNSAWYNSRSFGYTESESNTFVDTWKSPEGLKVKYNPRMPQQVYLGWKHFPLVSTLVIFIISALFSAALAAALEMILNSFNYEFVKLDNSLTVSTLIAPIIFMIYLGLSLFTTFTKKYR